MIPFIAFITSTKDFNILENYYDDIEVIRISLDNLNLISRKPTTKKLWLDPGTDALYSGHPNNEKFKDYLSKISGYDSLADIEFQKKPDKQIVREFTYQLLDKCKKYKPYWLSVPQLPINKKINQKKLNLMFAESTRQWADKNAYKGKLIIPIILTQQDHSKNTTKRNRIIQCSLANFKAVKADGVWIVDYSIEDLYVPQKTAINRISRLIDFHQKLKTTLPYSNLIIAGPYWGINLILWSKGFITNPVIGLGRGYRYILSGGVPRKAKVRIAIPSLRRVVKWNTMLKKWIKNAKGNSQLALRVRSEFNDIYNNFEKLKDNDIARNNIAIFYRHWLDNLLNTAPSGRALNLYQNFSDAYVIGKSLNLLPDSEKPADRPEQVAKQFMLNCL